MAIVQFPIRTPSSKPKLTEEEQRSNQEMLDSYFGETCLARRLKPETILNQRRINERLIEFCQRPLWRIGPKQYEQWIASVLKNKPSLKIGTQRSYQTAVSGLFGSLADDLDLQNKVFSEHGCRIVNPITRKNRIAHRQEQEAEEHLNPFTREQISQFFAAIKEDIRKTAHQPKLLQCHQRDLALFATQYYCGLRISELVALDLDSFEENPATRKYLGRFGAVRVRGKSTAGSPKKVRSAPVVNAALKPLMNWYLKDVRARFQKVLAGNKKALFLTIRGTRMTSDTARHHLKKYLRAAGIDPTGFATHTFRRSTLTQVSELGDMHLAQYTGGHVHQSTTQTYVKLPEPALNARLRSMVASTVDRATRTTRPRPKH